MKSSSCLNFELELIPSLTLTWDTFLPGSTNQHARGNASRLKTEIFHDSTFDNSILYWKCIPQWRNICGIEEHPDSRFQFLFEQWKELENNFRAICKLPGMQNRKWTLTKLFKCGMISCPCSVDSSPLAVGFWVTRTDQREDSFALTWPIRAQHEQDRCPFFEIDITQQVTIP